MSIDRSATVKQSTENPLPVFAARIFITHKSSDRSWLYFATQTAFMAMRFRLTKEGQISLQEASIAALTRVADRRVQSATFSWGVCRPRPILNRCSYARQLVAGAITSSAPRRRDSCALATAGVAGLWRDLRRRLNREASRFSVFFSPLRKNRVTLLPDKVLYI